jgi:membrane fusion protein (multidrug efflux system)
MNAANPAEAFAPAAAAAAPRRRFAISRKPLVMAAIAVAVALAGLVYMLSPRTAESTDNAYLRADSTNVAPRVGGTVAAVLVRDNQAVRAGDPLIRIDSQEYDSRLEAAEAAVADAVAGVAAARAALAGFRADEQLAASQVQAAQTAIGASEAEYARAAADRVRFETLASQGFATRRDAERVRAAAIGAASARDRSRADRQVSSEQAAVTRARRPVLLAGLDRALAAEARARAALDLARQDRGHTLVRAPIDGVIGNRQAQVGDYVQPGTRLLTVVPTTALYVVANFKETQTRRMLVGAPATISVDALGGKSLRGHVESFAPASGSEFALLPFEPGAGNFTKIVQRVAVRIRIDEGQPELRALRSGLSADVSISLRD